MAAQVVDGQILIVSCPGSGKTTTVVARTHNLIQSGIEPEKILVITFTKEAAGQMENRFKKEYPDDPAGTFFGTIHSFCYNVLRDYYSITPENILTGLDQWMFFSNLLFKIAPTDDFEEFLKQLISEISFMRNADIDYKKYLPQSTDPDLFRYACENYEKFKEKNGKFDFDDMIIIARELFKTDKLERDKWAKKYPYIMVDEFQDTNKIQADLIYLLAGEDGNLCIVGDDDQSIYRFRSADSNIMLNFPKTYPNAKVFYLQTNYRSGKKIVEATSRLIKNNKKRFEKDFNPCRKEDGVIDVYGYEKSLDQACDISAEIMNTHNKTKNPYEDFAILYRTNFENSMFILAMDKLNIPFYTTEAPKDIHSSFIFQDILIYYKLSRGLGKDGDLQKILNRPSRYLKQAIFTDCKTERDFLWAVKKYPQEKQNWVKRCLLDMFDLINDLSRIDRPNTFIRRLLVAGYDEFLSSFASYQKKDPELIEAIMDAIKEEASKFETMDRWIDYARHYTEIITKQRKNKEKKGVCLSTFHSAKGLEWDTVYVIDCNDGTTPHKKAESEDDYEEERRMFYVACTRAKNRLCLSVITGDEKRKMRETYYLQEMGFRRPKSKEVDTNIFSNPKQNN